MQKLKKTVLFGFGLILGVCIFSFGQGIEDAFHYIEIEQPSKARKILNEKLNDDKKTLSGQYALGIAYLRIGDLELALKCFEQGIAIKQKHGLNYAGMAHVKLLQNNSAEGFSLIEKALSLSRGKDAEVLRAVGAAYLTDKTQAHRAVEVLTKAKSLDNKDRETHFLLGDAYLMLNKGGESVSSYEWAAKSDPKWARPHFQIALVYNRSRNDVMSMESLNKAIAVDDSFAPAYKKLGEMYYLKKDANKAVEAYEKYLAITENPREARYQYAFFLIMAKQFDKANAIFEQVVHSKEVPTIALKYYAYSLLEQDTARVNAERAKPLLEQYMAKLKQEEIEAADYAYYGKLLLKLDEDSLANKNFNQSLALDSTQQDLLEIQAASLLKNRRFAEAARAYNRLLELREKPLLQDLWNLGQAYYFDEQFVEADTIFNKILGRQAIDKLPLQVVLYSARSKANIDSTMSVGLAKPMYEALLTRVSKSPEKYKQYIIEIYTYLGAYFIHKEENVAEAKGYYQKILELDSSNKVAQEFMNVVTVDENKGG